MRQLLPFGIFLLACVIAVFLFVPNQLGTVSYTNQDATAERAVAPVDEVEVPSPVDTRPVVSHVPLPDAVKAIYMSSCVAGTPSFRQDLVDLINETELNAVMIDIKDYSGTISFAPSPGSVWQGAWQDATCGARDMREFIEYLHEQDIFVIGRITVFQDPRYARANPNQAVLRSDQTTVWQDHKGLSFIDVASQDYWGSLVELAVESYNIGFDELNFDYVRYPSDGNMQDIYFPRSVAGPLGSDKQANLETFFAFLYEHMQNPELFGAVRHEGHGRTQAIPWTSADLFGMTTTNLDDLSIGQIQERAMPYFDFIAPMVYPSHYPPNYLNLGDPNDHPYEIVYHAMQSGVDRARATTTKVQGFRHEPIMTTVATGTPVFSGLYSKPAYDASVFRTWIQDFDYGGDYDAADVRAQIQASYDAGVDSWMIWAPSNRYTKAALLPVANEL